MRPPSGVNFTALDRRFSITCLIFRSSATNSPSRGVHLELRSMPWRAARSRTSMSVSCIAWGRSKRASSSSIRPASTLERSRMSLISESRCRPEDSTSWRYSSCLGFSSPNMRWSRTSEKPMIAFSGVRSSCDMLARNSDLCWFATSSSWLFSSISRKRCALAMATLDWLARAVMRLTMRSSNSPGRATDDHDAPATSPPPIGTVSTERSPSWRKSARNG